MADTTQLNLNNLILELADVEAWEKKLQTYSESEGSTISEFKKMKMEHQYKMGRLNEAIQKFLLDEGLEGETHLLKVCNHFLNKGKKTLVMA